MEQQITFTDIIVLQRDNANILVFIVPEAYIALMWDNLKTDISIRFFEELNGNIILTVFLEGGDYIIYNTNKTVKTHPDLLLLKNGEVFLFSIGHTECSPWFLHPRTGNLIPLSRQEM